MKILFADDMGMIRAMLATALEHRKHSVEVFTDGDELLERLLEPDRRPDLIITDNSMIRVSGLDVLWRIKNDKRYAELKSIPVIVYSADDSAKLKTEELGGIFVQKMLETNKLFDIVNKLSAKIAKERG
ncbi:MAG: response regulator [Patescibacteria group bacterium]